MATRYVWRKQDVAYGSTTGGYSSVYVGNEKIYAASNYQFDTDTGVFKLQDPTIISVSELENKSKYHYFMIGTSEGSTVYDNTQHDLPDDEVRESTTYSSSPSGSYRVQEIVYEDGKYVYKDVVDDNGKKLFALSQGGEAHRDSNGHIAINDTDHTTSNRDVTINGTHYGIGDSLVGAKGPNGGTLVITQPNYPQITTSSYTTSYYYKISSGYICVDSTSSGKSHSSRSVSRANPYNPNLIPLGGWTSSTSRYEEKASFRSIGIKVSPTGAGEYVSSRENDAYPQKGVSGGKYYTFTISDEPDPLGILVQDDDGKLRPEIEEVTLSISESTIATLKTYGTVQYTYYFSTDVGATWDEIETTDQTSIQFTIPRKNEEEVDNTTLMVGVKFKDNIGFIGDLVTSENYALTLNMPPVISDVDRDLGVLTSYAEDKPVIIYQVWDEDTEDVETTDEEGNTIIETVPSDIVTVEEYIDDVMIATYQFKGYTEYVFTFPDQNWLTLLNGEHTLQIIATDDKENTTVRTFTFTKAIDEISVMFEEPMESLEAMYLAVEEMVAELPTGCQIWVYVCNDGFDENPSWQDATVEVRNGTKIYITNAGIWDGKEPAELQPGYKWGYNVWVRIKRGTAEGPVYLTSIDGHWK